MSTVELERPIIGGPDNNVRQLVETAEQNGHRRLGESLVYTLDGRNSYIKDRAELAKGGDIRAIERLQRHDNQLASLPIETRELDGAEYEFRVNPNLTAGTGGEFAPPYWWIEKFAKAPRPGRVLQRLMPGFDLPDGVSSVNVPRITAGTAVESPSANAPTPNVDVETTSVKAEVATFSGNSDWSLQALEQSPPGAHLDWAAFVDLTDALESQVEQQLIAGTGKNEQLPGLTQISSNNVITYTSATPSGTEMVPFLGRALAQVGVKRQKPPEAILMTSARWFWLTLGSETTTNFPLGFVNEQGEWPIAAAGGVGVYLDDAIPTTFGAALPSKPSGGERDTIVVCRPEDTIMLTAPIKVAVLLDVLSGTMTARFRAWKRVAAFTHRFPQAVSVLSGTGMVTQTGFK